MSDLGRLEDRLLVLRDRLDNLNKFNPDQIRDKAGRWSETGAGEGYGTPGGIRTGNKRVDNLATLVRRVVPQMTEIDVREHSKTGWYSVMASTNRNDGIIQRWLGRHATPMSSYTESVETGIHFYVHPKQKVIEFAEIASHIRGAGRKMVTSIIDKTPGYTYEVFYDASPTYDNGKTFWGNLQDEYKPGRLIIHEGRNTAPAKSSGNTKEWVIAGVYAALTLGLGYSYYNARSKLVKAGFDPSEARDEEGQWSGSGSATFYHGTQNNALSRILRQGLKVSVAGKGGGEARWTRRQGAKSNRKVFFDKGVFLTSDKIRAQTYARSAVVNKQSPVILKLELPTAIAATLRKDSTDQYGFSSDFDIKPEWITGVAGLPKQFRTGGPISNFDLNIRPIPLGMRKAEGTTAFYLVVSLGGDVAKSATLEDRLLILQDRVDVAKAGFDPSEARDFHGRWESSAGGSSRSKGKPLVTHTHGTWFNEARISAAVSSAVTSPTAKELLATTVASVITSNQNSDIATEAVTQSLLNLSTGLKVTQYQARDMVVDALTRLRAMRVGMKKALTDPVLARIDQAIKHLKSLTFDDVAKLEDRALILQDKLDVLKAGFKPSQERGYHGRWSEGGGNWGHDDFHMANIVVEPTFYGGSHGDAVAQYNKYIGIRPADFKREMYGSFADAAKIAISGTAPAKDLEPGLSVNASLYGAGKKFLGAMYRSFSIDNGVKTVGHDAFELEDSETGKSLAKPLLSSAFGLYKDIGYDQVSLMAADKIGAYAWARYGFQPYPTDWRIVANKAQERYDWGKKQGYLDSKDDSYFKKVIASPDPRAIWGLADMERPYSGPIYQRPTQTKAPLDYIPKVDTVGKFLLQEQGWMGTMNLKDPVQMGRFSDYVMKKSSRPLGKSDKAINSVLDRLLVLQDRMDVMKAGYKDDEPRDEGGKWTDSGSSNVVPLSSRQRVAVQRSGLLPAGVTTSGKLKGTHFFAQSDELEKTHPGAAQALLAVVTEAMNGDGGYTQTGENLIAEGAVYELSKGDKLYGYLTQQNGTIYAFDPDGNFLPFGATPAQEWLDYAADPDSIFRDTD